MDVGIAGFYPKRLKEARDARRIPSMAALSRALSLDPSTVSRWENGTYAPDAEGLVKLANFFGVRQEYFLRPTCDSARPTFLRSLQSTHKRDLAYQRAQMCWLQETSQVVEHYVDLPAVDIPDVLGGKSWRQLTGRDIEDIAGKLRVHWGLGDGPCTDVVGLMERVGFVVSVIEMGTTKLDGLCSWSPVDERPHVLLASDKMCYVRRQMDAAHEMAHGILHRFVTEAEFEKELKLIESQAFRLASAFLMPSTSYPIELKSASLANMLALKERWRVSVKAQIRRLSDLGIIPHDAYSSLSKLYSAKGWSRQEPLDRNWKPSDARLLKDAMHLIVEENVRSKNDLLGLEFTISAGDIENLVGLPNGWFSSEMADIVALKPAVISNKLAEEQSAEILNFNKLK